MDHNLSSHCSPMTFLLFFGVFSSAPTCIVAGQTSKSWRRIRESSRRLRGSKPSKPSVTSLVRLASALHFPCPPPFCLFFFFFSILFFSPLILWPSLIMVAVCMLNSGVLCWYYSGFLNNLMHAKAIKRLTSSPYLSCTQSPLTCCLVWFTS